MKRSVLVALLVLFGGIVEAQNEIWTIPKPKPVAGGEEYKQGEEAFKNKDWSGAISAFEAAVSQNEDLFASYYYLGWAYKSTSKPGNRRPVLRNFWTKRRKMIALPLWSPRLPVRRVPATPERKNIAKRFLS